jgi:nucleoside-diphosphate-sugar epimerase
VPEAKVAVLGGASLVGRCLLSQLQQAGCKTVAFSRRQPLDVANGTVAWHPMPPLGAQENLAAGVFDIPFWICVAPIWVLPAYFSWLESCGVRKVVALSSTSRFSKIRSTDPDELRLVTRLAEAEARVQAWAESRGIEWVVLRPTIIYGQGQDKNLAEIARFIRRFRFFPLFGSALGLRQPIHAADVAGACFSALQSSQSSNHAYNLSGGETLTYRDMVARVFIALGKAPRLLTVPLWVFRLALLLLRCLPRYRHWTAAMAERMNQDLVFEHSAAQRDLGFNPRGFALTAEDVPR